MNIENRRVFLQKFGLIALATGTTGNFSSFSEHKHSTKHYPGNFQIKLESLSPNEIFSKLNLDYPGLEQVKKHHLKRKNDQALAELLKYYKSHYAKTPELTESSGYNLGNLFSKQSSDSSISKKKSLPYNQDYQKIIDRADNLGKHIFQWGPYKEADYGPDIDWAADPAGDIEWVASVYRFSWANDLVNAFLVSGDEKYAKIFVDLTTDWIKKHPLEKTLYVVHPVYKEGVYGSSGWKGYPWLDIQTGIRATNICKSFRTFLHTKAFTPEFLGILIASLYDHQKKTEEIPMNQVHNKAIFEQRGFFNVLHTFPEFKEKEKWLDIGIGISYENLLAQTTADGVQREWCGGYHLGVYRDALEIKERANALGRNMPDLYNSRLKLMADHIFGISTPELGFPMFGDTSRGKQNSHDRKSWSLYNVLSEASEKFNDPKYKALADLNVQLLPLNGSVAFSEAGLYVMRNKWSVDQTYMTLHCSPPGYSIHDTPDNGTFELYSSGRWLMPDSGFYTYGHDPQNRSWHRQTRVHATMTINGADTNKIGRQLIWNSNLDTDILCVENHSYTYFIHRRTIWFTGKRSELPFFVILDEGIGGAKGDIAIHFPMAPGVTNTDHKKNIITTDFDDSNLLIQVTGTKPFNLIEEEGWHSWGYGQREKRISVSAVHKGQGPLVFVSVLIPFKGKSAPAYSLLTKPETLIAGMNPVKLEVKIDNKNWSLERNL